MTRIDTDPYRNQTSLPSHFSHPGGFTLLSQVQRLYLWSRILVIHISKHPGGLIILVYLQDFVHFRSLGSFARSSPGDRTNRKITVYLR